MNRFYLFHVSMLIVGAALGIPALESAITGEQSIPLVLQSARYGGLACSAQPLAHTPPNQRYRRDRRLRVRPQSRLEALHKANEVDDSAVESHTSRGTRAKAIIDLHVTTTRKHDSQIAPSLIERNTGDVAVLLGDTGYDAQKVRALAHGEDVRPYIKHREFSSLHKAWNTRLDADLYGQRTQNETVNSRLKRKYGAFVRSRHWWKQFRELTIACLTHNLD